MDIIQLLEVLKPAKDVITVQVASAKDPLAPTLDLIKAVLPAFLTAVVALATMAASFRQFKISSENQSEHFRAGIEQQVRSLKLSTQLATEVELKKENCRSVREACSQFLAIASDAYNHKRDYTLAQKTYDESKANGFDKDLHKELLDAVDGLVATSQKFTTAYIFLYSFLDEEKDDAFVQAVIKVSDVYNKPDDTGVDIGKAIGECGRQLRFYIQRKHAEIISLSESISY